MKTALDIPDRMRHASGLQNSPLGLYVHIPFCRRKCRYCDFFSITDLSLIEPFVQCLLKEIDIRAAPSLFADSIHIGGGTPSVVAASDLGRVIDALRRSYRMAENVEITMEVNPGTVTAASVAAYHRLGFRRINIGVQSFKDANLFFLGRLHTADEAVKTVDWARGASFDNIGIDLIYGIPGQSSHDWQADLEQAVALDPEHLSCYLLTIEDGTPLKSDLDGGLFQVSNGALQTELYQLTVDFLTQRGYVQYEISNFSRSTSLQSRHNVKYWSGAPYIGFGPSAHSFLPPKRSWNVADLPGYLGSIKAGRLPTEGEEVLTPEQRIIEGLFLGLRQTGGIDIEAFDKQFATSFTARYRPVIESLMEQGLIEIRGQHCRLTRNGMVLMDSVVDQFVG